jgi:hypothetical protein
LNAAWFSQPNPGITEYIACVRKEKEQKGKIESYSGINPFSSAIFWPSAPTTKSIYAFAQDEGSPNVYK